MATDKIAILPGRFNVRERVVLEALGVPVVQASVNQSPLVGVLASANSHGMVASDLLEDREAKVLKEHGLKVVRAPGKFTAIGNLVLANDYGALVSPDLPDDALPVIQETLGVPVERATIAGLKTVGAAAVATNKGVLAHPDINEDEVEVVKRVLRVPVDVGTACGGVKYIGVCVVANSHGAITGKSTTGPELGRIESALGFI